MDYQLQQIVAEVTQRCNFRCLHCGSACTNVRAKDELTNDEWRDLVFTPAAQMGVESIVLSGGEPTTRTEFPTLCQLAHDSRLRYAFITNGYNLSDELLETVDTHRPYAVGFSIDGLKDTHNFIRQNDESWSRLMRSISAVQETGIDACAITTVNGYNLRQLARLGDFIAMAELPSWQIQIAMPAGRMDQKVTLTEVDFQELCQTVMALRQKYPQVYIQAADCFGMAPAGTVRSFEWAGCGAGISSIGMDAVGNIMPCLSVREDMTAGNVRARSLNEIWSDDSSFTFARKFNVEDASGGPCWDCKKLESCRGGCISQSLSFAGRLHATAFCFERSFGEE